MNLSEIRSMIGSIIDYDPQVQSYKDEVNRIVNEIYLEFFTSQAWKFSQKSIDYYTHTDVIDTAAVINFQSLSETILSAKITLSSNFFLANSNTPTRFGQIRREGDVLKITGASDDINNGLYIIDKVNADGINIEVSKYSSNSPRHFFRGTAGTTEVVTVSIEERHLKLPYDCMNILSVGIRNLEEAGVGTNAVGHVFALSRRDDEELGLRDDFVGTPTTWIPYDHPPSTVNRVVRDFIPRSGKDFNVINATTGFTAWPAGTYEFCVAYELHGNVGPKSDPISVVIDRRPTFTFQDTTKLGGFGLRKRIYFRIKSVEGLIVGQNHEENFWRDLGAFTYASTTTASLGALVVEDTVTSYELPFTETWYPFTTLNGLLQVPRETVVLDNRWRIRLHPRPSTQTPMRIRYMYYPGKLLDDYDSPNSPTDTHRYLVYRACQELFVKHKNPNMALYYEKKADDEMRKCEKRYLSERAQYYIKGGISGGPQRLRPFRNLTHGTGRDGT